MNFPVPRSSVEIDNRQPTHEQQANQAAEARRAEQIRYALAQRPQPQMVRTIDPPSQQELTRQRNQRLQRQGNDAGSFRSQLEAIGEERTSIRIALDSARRSVDEALRDGRNHDVKKLRARIEDLGIELERMNLLAEEARGGLAQAEAAEEERRASLEKAIPAAERAIAEHAKALKSYPEHATAIAKIVAMELAANAARQTVQAAAIAIPGYRPPPASSEPGLHGRVLLPGYLDRPRAPVTAMNAYER